MYTAINGIYEDGNLTLTETPPTTKKANVVVLFLEERESADLPAQSGKGVRLGSLEGQHSIPDTFNELLDDLADYV